MHHKTRFVAIVVLVIAGLAACRTQSGPASSDETGGSGAGVALKLIAQGLEAPLYVTAQTGDARVFIVEQPGRIRIVKDGVLLEKPFLDIAARIKYGGECGLLSVAFHPGYASNGYFFVNYTDHEHGDTHVERYSVTSNPDIADPSSAKLILKVEQPYANHNGGHIQFGPDGMLYIGMGDGGSAGDPHGNGQDRSTLLGDLLRIDVDHGDPYAIPRDNPFVNKQGMRGEIWAWGLRNPWRFAIDRGAGILYIADVGQNLYEELDIAPVSQPGLNYGWNVMEGKHCFKSKFCSSEGMTPPALEYGHSQGCSIIGGYVYRGKSIPAISGQYFYADYCLGWIKSIKFQNGSITDRKTWKLGVEGNVLSFGVDAAGELYVLFSNGKVYKFVPA